MTKARFLLAAQIMQVGGTLIILEKNRGAPLVFAEQDVRGGNLIPVCGLPGRGPQGAPG